jgi:hypothetical protein
MEQMSQTGLPPFDQGFFGGVFSSALAGFLSLLLWILTSWADVHILSTLS